MFLAEEERNYIRRYEEKFHPLTEEEKEEVLRFKRELTEEDTKKAIETLKHFFD